MLFRPVVVEIILGNEYQGAARAPLGLEGVGHMFKVHVSLQSLPLATGEEWPLKAAKATLSRLRFWQLVASRLG